MERITATQPMTWEHVADSAHLITMLAGTLTITHADQPETLTRGQSIVIPAALRQLQFFPQPDATWLHCWVPEA
jgi:mannose-6-phosphate isomerase class I